MANVGTLIMHQTINACNTQPPSFCGYHQYQGEDILLSEAGLASHLASTEGLAVTLFVHRIRRLLRPHQKNGIRGYSDRQIYMRRYWAPDGVKLQANLSLRFDLFICHPLSVVLGFHLMFLLQTPFIYGQIRTYAQRGDLVIPSRRYGKQQQRNCRIDSLHTWTQISKRSHHFVYSASRRLTSSICSKVYAERSNIPSSPDGTSFKRCSMYWRDCG
jgi:hypothetical protein